MVAFVAVPVALAGFKEGVHAGLVDGHFCAADPVGDGVGGQSCNRTAAANDIFTDGTGDLYGIAYFYGLACGNIDVPNQLVTVAAEAVRSRNERGVSGDFFLNDQPLVSSTGVSRAVSGMVRSIVGVIAVIGDSNCVCNVLALHSGAHMGNIYRAVDIHSGILHTDVGRILNGKAGGL